MSFENISTEIPLDMQPDCARCPHLCMLGEQLDEVNQQKQNVTAFAQSPEIEKLIEGSNTVVIGPGFAGMGEDALASMRASAASHLDHLDEHDDQVRKTAAALQNGCPGALAMRAQDRLGRTVTVRICGSPAVETITQGSTESTIIKRTPPTA